MRQLLLIAIRLYQRFVSPYKGFSCAYRVHTGRGSCSAFGYRAVRRHGVLAGLALIRERTRLCGEVHRHCEDTGGRPAAAFTAPARLGSQRGVCDPGCDFHGDAGCLDKSCDLPCGGPRGLRVGTLCEIADCLPCDCCDCFDWNRKKKEGRGRPARQRRMPSRAAGRD